MRHRIFLTALLLLGTQRWAAGQATTPLDEYRSTVAGSQMLCELTLYNRQLNVQIGAPQDEKSDVGACIVKETVEAKRRLDVALKTLKKPAAREALKNVHVAYVTAIEGVHPSNGERKVQYEARQASLRDKVTAAWARFDVEQ